MSEERRKILEMLWQAKITVDEAERLLSALTDEEAKPASDSDKPTPRYLRVHVEPGPGSDTQERVNIRVPMKLIRAGLKWAALMPKHAQKSVNHALHEKGIDMDFTKMTPKDIEDLVSNLDDLTVDVEGKEKVRIFCE